MTEILTVECPHCEEERDLGQLGSELWPQLDDGAQYYLFHEGTEFLAAYWRGENESAGRCFSM